jgi:hypothetical protein
MPVLDQSRHYHNWNNLFLWLISAVASIETTEACSFLGKRKNKIQRQRLGVSLVLLLSKFGHAQR